MKNHPKDLYKKTTGRDYRGSTYKYYAIATANECAEWDAEQERKRQVAEATAVAKNKGIIYLTAFIFNNVPGRTR